MQLPSYIVKVLDMLENAGYEAFIVGGCVRDSLMGNTPHDYDITTSALPEETERVFSGMRLIETGMKHGTVTVIADGSPVEITTYRVDGEYHDSRRPDHVSFTRSLREDIARRDFTVNGIAYSPKRGMFDYFGGAEDIRRRVIRCIGEPEKRFHEDALRILRGLRFSASLGFEIEKYTALAMLDSRELLLNISAERIFSELSGMLTGRESWHNIRRVMSRFRDIFAVIIPELRECFDFEQHSKYHCLDVYQHSICAAENAALLSRSSENALPLTLAMLLHDIGKPHRFSLDENGEGHFYGHAAVSEEMADVILHRLKCSTALRERVCRIIRYHDVPLPENEKALRRFLSKHGEQSAQDIAMAHIADNMAQSPEFHGRCDKWRSVLERMHELSAQCCLTTKQLAVDGRSLSGIVPPSPLMGEVLKHLLDGVVDGSFPNEREFLLQEAEKYVANRDTI